MKLVIIIFDSIWGECGNPLQYSCLENPMDRGALWATVHRVARSQTQLKWLSMHTTSPHIKKKILAIQKPVTLCWNQTDISFPPLLWATTSELDELSLVNPTLPWNQVLIPNKPRLANLCPRRQMDRCSFSKMAVARALIPHALLQAELSIERWGSIC